MNTAEIELNKTKDRVHRLRELLDQATRELMAVADLYDSITVAVEEWDKSLITAGQDALL